MFSTFSILLGAVYAAGMLLFALTLAKRRAAADQAYRPTVSVVVAARNEEDRIGACLSSLTTLSYPPNLLEVIVVDDHSTDGTQDVVRRLVGSNPAIRLVKAGEGQGKANALATGIEESKGEILLFTDADCTVPPGWVEGIVQHYADPETAIVAGFITLGGKGWFAGIQELDWLALLSAASATAGLGFPVTAVGNNLSIRRSVYDRIGGYRNIPFSVTEDLALVKAVTVNHAGRVLLPLTAETAIRTTPCSSISELFAQRRRWFVGGRGAPASRALAFSVVYLFHLALVAGAWLLDPLLWAGLLVLKLVADYLLVFPPLFVLKKHRLVRYWLQYQVYQSLYILILPLLAILSPGISWKGRKFRGNEPTP